MGLGSHPERIMIKIVMLLISGLSTTNGIREVLQRDFISGTLNIMNSCLGGWHRIWNCACDAAVMECLRKGMY